MADATKKPQRIPVLVQLRERLEGHGAWTRDVKGELVGAGALVAIKDMTGVEHLYPVSVAKRIDLREAEA